MHTIHSSPRYIQSRTTLKIHALFILTNLFRLLFSVSGSPLLKDATTAKNLAGLNSLQSGHARTIITYVKSSSLANLKRRTCEVIIITKMQESSLHILANLVVPASKKLPYDDIGYD